MTDAKTAGPVPVAPVETVVRNVRMKPSQGPLSMTLPASGQTQDGKTAPEDGQSGKPAAEEPVVGFENIEIAKPEIPGLEDADWAALHEDEKRKLEPILRRVERVIGATTKEAQMLQQKAAAWDAALTVPAVREALERHVKGEEPVSEKETPELDFDIGDPEKLQSSVASIVKSELGKALSPLQQQLSALYEVVARRELDAQFQSASSRMPDIEKYRDEIIRMLADDRAKSVEDAYDIIIGRQYRTKRIAPKDEKQIAEQIATTVVSHEAGPPPGRVVTGRSSGMLAHLRAAMREHGIRISEGD